MCANINKFISMALILSMAVSQVAKAQDYIGMAVQYGQNMQNILHTEIMNDVGRQTMKQANKNRSGTSASRKASWPSHITDKNATSHHYTVSELADMYSNDPVRTRQLISGQTITVQGKVKLPDRDDLSSFNLTSPSGSGYYVWAYFDKTRLPNSIHHGSTISISGVAEVKRRGHLNLRSPRISNSTRTSSSSRNIRASTSVSTHSKQNASKAVGIQSLRFTPNSTVTKKANRLIVDNVASALKPSVSKHDLLKILDGGDTQREFAKVAKKEGFSDRDLADVLTVSTVLCWQLTNGVDKIDQPQGYKKIRDHLRQAIVSSDWLQNADNEQKQLMAELTSTGSMIIVSRYIHGRKQKDNSIIQQSRKDARQFMKQITGMDMSRYRLTAKGLEPK